MQMTRGEWLKWERQGEDICVCRDDRKKDRYGVSVTVPGEVGEQRQVTKTEIGMRREHNASGMLVLHDKYKHLQSRETLTKALIDV